VGSSEGELCEIILFWLVRNASKEIIQQQKTSGRCKTVWK